VTDISRDNSRPVTIVDHDPWLAPFADAVQQRRANFLQLQERIVGAVGDLATFATAHNHLGLNRGERDGTPGVWYREWAPRARALSLAGDFNDWDRGRHPLDCDAHGVWSLFLPDDDYAERLTHGSRVKVHVDSAIGPRDRVPAYIRRAISDPHSHDFCGQFWAPPMPYSWQHQPPPCPANLRIYEAHVGMALEDARIGTYNEFVEQVLPRIVRAGYNAIQLMAIQEHPYYGSFGYQVSSFFAPSSRFGTPEELKALIDAAHGAGLVVLLDLVHSHAVKNINEGLNHFDGTEYQYFHGGGRGQHPAWDSLCFDYGKWEVLQFLLSNVRYWLEDFRFDGFRFDGVTSMIYLDHGLGRAFSSYDHYFPPHVDEDAIAYLQVANALARAIKPDAITIAEDVSGMVGMAWPANEGGVGFDYRLAMGLPDYWIRTLRDRADEQWQMDEIFRVMTNRRANERHIAYVESHDQALVGDKTIAMWLLDADIYYHMSKGTPNLTVERGVALHKMIRLVTFFLGGEGWLNFIGNEFGHPEWVDFPREGNNFSFAYARRQWSLVDDPLLRYQVLGEFDRALQQLDAQHGVLGGPWPELIQVHEDNKLLACSRGPLVCVMNFHPTRSLPDYRVGVPAAGTYVQALSSDDIWFGGHAEILPGQRYPAQAVPWDHRGQSVQVYLPARTALVLAPEA
jgi:1,4-alpha-glucan branching enzyme